MARHEGESHKILPLPPMGLHWRSHSSFIVATVGLGAFSDTFLYGVAVPILPFMLRDRTDVPETEIQLRTDEMLAIYGLGSMITAPIAGYLSDRLDSRKFAFLSGTIALFFATCLFIVGDSLTVLYIARLLQGISGGILWPVGLALALDTVGQRNLGKAIGTVGFPPRWKHISITCLMSKQIFTFCTFGQLISPTVGGILYTTSGYTGVFLCSGAILIVDFLMRLVLIEKHVATKWIKSNDAEVMASGDVPQQRDQSRSNEDDPLLRRPHDRESEYRIASGPSSLIRRFPNLYYLRSGSLQAAFFIIMIHGILLGTFNATVPTFLKEQFEFTPLGIGFMFLNISIPDIMSGPIIGWMVDRYGTKLVATAAFAYLTPVLVSLRAITGTDKAQLILYCVLLGLCGFGLGLPATPATVEATAVLTNYYEANKSFFRNRPAYSQLYGLNVSVYTAGLALGPLIAGTMKHLTNYGDMNILLGVICAITAVIAWYSFGAGVSK